MMIKPEYRYSELTGKIIGCAMEVHNQLGNGFQEFIYQRALEYEMELQKIMFSREFEMPIFYKDKHIGTRRADFLVEDKICVELKAFIKLEPVHLAQAINYLEAYNWKWVYLLTLVILNLIFTGSKIRNSDHHDYHMNHIYQS